ncbi:apolipoprotein N-acyltransferase, partial [Candidatus Margulisiibacteriota bacterium]
MIKHLLFNKGANKSEYFLPLISGILLVSAFPYFNLSFLVWIALVPLLYIIQNKKSHVAFKAGFSTGFIFFGGLFYWLIAYNGVVPYLILILYLAFCLAILSFLINKATNRRSFFINVFSPAIIWVSFEFISAFWPFNGFLWFSLAYTQFRFLSLIQLSTITGIYGITFLILLVNSLLALYLTCYINKREVSPSLKSSSVAIILLLILSVGWGHRELRGEQIKTEQKNVGISIIQGNVPYWLHAVASQNISYENIITERYLNIIEIAKEKKSNLIILPEAIFPFDILGNSTKMGDLLKKLKNNHSYFLLSSYTHKNNNKYNSAVLFDPDVEINSIYHKNHLVPFGEYDLSSGSNYNPIATPFGKMGVLICFEAIFPRISRKMVRGGADILLNISNDAWFLNTSGPYQHGYISIFRAIENRRPLVRAANTGISMIIDPYGRIIKQTNISEECILEGTINSSNIRTFYALYGDIFA